MKKDSLLTRQLDEYRLISLLGKGGMARVYLGLDIRLRRYVAIKVIDLPHRDDPEYIHRFEREAQAVAQLEHPNVVRLYRYGEVQELLYMAMQYIEGADLGTVLATYARDGELIPQNDIVSIIQDVTHALDYAHARGVIHRDIKPSNIMLDKEGRAVLTDFGLALFAENETQGEIFGTPQYTAPEQVMSSAMVVPQSDLYSVGIILYEMFTGQVPFDDPDPLDLAVQHINQTPRPPRQLNPAMSQAAEDVILKALAKRPDDRYQTGAQLAAALRQAVGGQTGMPVLIPQASSGLTIPERVTTVYEKQPLPPLPTDVGAVLEPPFSAPARAVPQPPRPAAPHTISRLEQPLSPPETIFGLTPLTAVLGCAGLLLFLGLLFSGGLLIFRGMGGFAPEDDTDFMPVVVSPGTTQSTTGTPATPLPGGLAEYNLRLLKNGQDSFFLVNIGDQPFPLGPLRLGDGPGSVEGADWEADLLQRGSCVTAWQDQTDPPPAAVTCVEVGSRLNRKDEQRFWDNDFTVYYSDQPIGVCPQDFPECLVTVTITAGPTP